MQQHRWRWLWIWVGVLVAGCGQVWSSEGTRTATREPTLPLLGYTLLPASLTPGFWSAYTATPLIPPDGASMIISPSPIALYLNVTGPTCYETPIGSLVCLGQVYNMLDSPVEQVTVGVQLLARDGTPLTTGEALLARWLLPAGAAGPYRVLFDSMPDGVVNARPFILSGQIALDRPVSGFAVYHQPESLGSRAHRRDDDPARRSTQGHRVPPGVPGCRPPPGTRRLARPDGQGHPTGAQHGGV
jgi:hypothetical protein